MQKVIILAASFFRSEVGMVPLVENPLSWVYFPTALALGALHAIEPGHAKTLTAAYLIGIKGTKKDAFLLGLSVALTHSIVVIGISVLALWIGKETFTQDITRWLQIGSGSIVVLLGIWMLQKRIKIMKKQAQKHAIQKHAHHHEEPTPIHITSDLLTGKLAIMDTATGERMKFSVEKFKSAFNIRIIINRPDGLEVITFQKSSMNSNEFISDVAPNEPHEFSAEFEITLNDNSREVIPFEMHEPEGHDHSDMSDDEHARAHAEAMPEYAKRGERPTLGQIIAFGAAGGMIPCPASITVMLLALSIGKFSAGLLAVAGFSIGLSVTLVGIGLIVVAGISRLEHSSGRFHWVSSKAPIISASVVIFSGLISLLFVH
jgi:nickel/cobalt exporter